MGGAFLSRRFRGLPRPRPRQWYGRGERVLHVMVNGRQWKLVASIDTGIQTIGYRDASSPAVEWWPVRLKTGGYVKKKKVGDAATTAAKHLVALESVTFQKLHALVAHCAVTQYDDGDPRRPGWFTVKTMGSSWVIEVKDPDACCKLTVVQTTLDDALALACLLLESEETPWERDQWLVSAQAKGKKK